MRVFKQDLALNNLQRLICNDFFFTDEAWLPLSGCVNPESTRLSLSNNPHGLHKTHLHDLKVGMEMPVV